MWLIVKLESKGGFFMCWYFGGLGKLVYNLLEGLITYLYRGYNPLAKYHGHPSSPNKSSKRFQNDMTIRRSFVVT